MAEKTGNRWRDPDKVYNPDGSRKPREEWDKTETLANPDNIDLNTFKGKDAAKRKYGPAVTDPSPDAVAGEALTPAERAAAAIAAAHAPAISTDSLPAIPAGKINPKLGERPLEAGVPAVAPPLAVRPPLADDIPDLKDRIRELGRAAQDGEAAATAQLTKIAEAEYGREGGPRTPIQKLLNAYGIGRPQATAPA